MYDALQPLATPDFPQVWNFALRAITEVNFTRINPLDDNHFWHNRLRERHKLHPLIVRMVHEFRVRPVEWQRMLLEWPHVSIDRPDEIAYTRTQAHGVAFLDDGDKRQTRTTVGKYLARHYPHIPDHLRRDIAGLFNAPHYEIWTTREQIVCGVELGPQSCMRSSYGSIPFGSRDNEALVSWHAGDKDIDVRWEYHPYWVYKPEYGWSIAVQIDKGKPDVVLARALLWQNPKDAAHRGYVRSYIARGDWSESDHTLEAWLKERGYVRFSAWPKGAALACVNHPDRGMLMPYIDGGTQRVRLDDTVFRIDPNGPYDCTNTDGTTDTADVIGDCECCGCTLTDDDSHVYAGVHEEILICENCQDNDYQYVTGAVRGYTRNYYVHADDAVEVSGDYYDVRNLPDCVVTDVHGDYRLRDDVVHCDSDDEYYDPCDDDIVEIDGDWYRKDDDDIVEIDGDWYRKDDSDVIKCADDEYRLKNDCWQCEYSSEWYPDDEPSVDVSEGTYHPDALRDMADNA